MNSVTSKSKSIYPRSQCRELGQQDFIWILLQYVDEKIVQYQDLELQHVRACTAVFLQFRTLTRTYGPMCQSASKIADDGASIWRRQEAGSDVLRREAEAKPKNESYSTVQVARSGPPDKQNEWLTFVSFLMLIKDLTVLLGQEFILHFGLLSSASCYQWKAGFGMLCGGCTAPAHVDSM
jgi:hypothetical protein